MAVTRSPSINFRTAGDTRTTIERQERASTQNGSLNPSLILFSTSLITPVAPRNVLDNAKNSLPTNNNSRKYVINKRSDMGSEQRHLGFDYFVELSVPRAT